jgi:hypothetical protein
VRWQFPVGLKGAVELQDALSNGHKDGFVGTEVSLSAQERQILL